MIKPESFIENLYCTHYIDLLNFAEILLRNKEIAQDVVQDTFHDALRKADELFTHPNPSAWLVKTVKYKAQRAKRDQARFLKYISAGVPLIADLNSSENKIFLQEVLSFAKDSLSGEDFLIFTYFFLEEHSHSYIAKKLGISVWASRKRIERIRSLIKSVHIPARTVNKNKHIINFLIFCVTFLLWRKC